MSEFLPGTHHLYNLRQTDTWIIPNAQWENREHTNWTQKKNSHIWMAQVDRRKKIAHFLKMLLIFYLHLITERNILKPLFTRICSVRIFAALPHQRYGWCAPPKLMSVSITENICIYLLNLHNLLLNEFKHSSKMNCKNFHSKPLLKKESLDIVTQACNIQVCPPLTYITDHVT